MKLFNVDAALRENMPVVRFRGQDYRLRDLTVGERITKIIEYRQAVAEAEEEAAEKAEAAGEDVPEALTLDDSEEIREVVARAIQDALVGVPDDVARSITEREWEALQDALPKARNIAFDIEPEELDGEDSGKAKGSGG